MSEPVRIVSDPPAFATGRAFPALRLGLACLAIGVVWLVALPWVASRPAVDAHLQNLKARGVDPSAMYYTDLECLEPVLDRLNRESRRAGHASP